MLEVSIEKRYDEAPGSAGFSLEVDFQAQSGITALFGPSGAGKTLTLSAVAGFIRPDGGRVAVGGETLFDSDGRIDVPARARRCGYLFQQGALFPHMTVRENVLFAAPEDAPSVDALLERFRIAGIAARRPHEISGGERQRCAIARTLAARPRVLLMDEPGQGLDVVLRRELHAIVVELRRELDIPMLLVTHDLGEAFALADRMLVIADGRLHDRGEPQEIYRRPSSRRTARLLGLDGVFEGRVVESDSATGYARLQPESGPAIVTPSERPLAAGSAVSYCIRPDAVLARPRNGVLESDEVAVRLERVEPAADHVRLYFDGGLSAQIPADRYRRHAAASEWSLRFPADSVWVFPE